MHAGCALDQHLARPYHRARARAASLFDAGAQVVFTGADTPAVAEVATEKGKWGVTYDWVGSCTAAGCLTAPYWIWGPTYAKITTGLIDGSYTPGYDYFDAETGEHGAVWLYGGPGADQGSVRPAARGHPGGPRHAR